MTTTDIDALLESARQDQSAGRLESAIARFRQVLAANPKCEEAANRLAKALLDSGDTYGAVEAGRKYLALRPNDPQAHNNFALTLLANNFVAAAIASLHQSLSLQPNAPEVYVNLAEALVYQNEINQAIEACRQAIRLQPEYALAHMKLGELLLITGHFDRGLPEYDWRYRLVIKDRAEYEQFKSNLWDGEDLNGKRIVLGAEGGFGDFLQFVRYVPQVAQRGGKVLLACPPEMQRLMQGFAGVEKLIPTGEPPPPCDVHSPLINLMKVFATRLEKIPAKTPYLFADKTLAKSWQKKLEDFSGRLKVGIAWAGSPRNRYDRTRSLKLSNFLPLTKIPGVALFSLQKGNGSEQLAQAPEGMEIVDWTNQLNDFADTAALIENLDAIIVPDSALAHLGGAMGKPTMVLMPFLHDWRWLLAPKVESPWYPTIRLFRQATIHNWNAPIQQLVEYLISRFRL